MAELQLKVVKNTGDGIWGKALNNFNKVLYSSGGGLFNIVINSKRSALIKANASYVEMINIPNEKKRNTIADKYEKAYDGSCCCRRTGSCRDTASGGWKQRDHRCNRATGLRE